jgi:hypothetical protein
MPNVILEGKDLTIKRIKKEIENAINQKEDKKTDYVYVRILYQNREFNTFLKFGTGGSIMQCSEEDNSVEGWVPFSLNGIDFSGKVISIEFL